MLRLRQAKPMARGNPLGTNEPSSNRGYRNRKPAVEAYPGGKLSRGGADRQPANCGDPQIVDFETFIDARLVEEVGLQPRDGKLRLVLGAPIRHLPAPGLRPRSCSCCSGMDS